MPSVLWRCWLGARKGIRAAKKEWWGAGVVICLERGADLHMAQLMPLTVSSFSKIQIGFTFLVPAHLGSPGKRAVKRVCVCVCNWRLLYNSDNVVPSVLWHCWLGVRKSIRLVKIEWWGVGAVICLEQGADYLYMVQRMPPLSQNPIISCLI